MTTRQILSIALALTGAASTHSLRAQTGLGERHIDVALLVEAPDLEEIGTGFGAGAKFNFPVGTFVDLHASAAAIGFDEDYGDVAHGLTKGGLTLHGNLGPGQAFLTLEIGFERLVVDWNYSSEDTTDNETEGVATAGYAFNLSPAVQLAPYVSYTYYKDADEREFSYGAQLAIRLSRVVSLVGEVSVSDESDTLGGAGVRFHF